MPCKRLRFSAAIVVEPGETVHKPSWGVPEMVPKCPKSVTKVSRKLPKNVPIVPQARVLLGNAISHAKGLRFRAASVGSVQKSSWKCPQRVPIVSHKCSMFDWANEPSPGTRASIQCHLSCRGPPSLSRESRRTSQNRPQAILEVT